MAKSYYSLGCGLSRAEAIAGWCYLPFYLVLLSAGIQYAAALLHLSLSALTINIVYFSINLLFVLRRTAMSYLRRKRIWPTLSTSARPASVIKSTLQRPIRTNATS